MSVNTNLGLSGSYYTSGGSNYSEQMRKKYAENCVPLQRVDVDTKCKAKILGAAATVAGIIAAPYAITKVGTVLKAKGGIAALLKGGKATTAAAEGATKKGILSRIGSWVKDWFGKSAGGTAVTDAVSIPKLTAGTATISTVGSLLNRNA